MNKKVDEENENNMAKGHAKHLNQTLKTVIRRDSRDDKGTAGREVITAAACSFIAGKEKAEIKNGTKSKTDKIFESDCLMDSMDNLTTLMSFLQQSSLHLLQQV